MHRRTFLKNSLATSAGALTWPTFNLTGLVAPVRDSFSELEKGFTTPPDSARPWVFWMWMNGNVTKEGITADLEAMQRMGIGGVINFNSAVGIPRGPVDYASEAWMEATAHAATECQRLGLEMTMHNSPGYSGAGGPWITPEMSMQQLVWTETLGTSTGTLTAQLPQPAAKHGYYRDALVVAYPSLPVERALMKDKLVRVLANGREIDKSLITDGSTETKIRLDSLDGVTDNISLVLEFSEPFEARALSILRRPETPRDLFDGPRDHPPLFFLESSPDGVTYARIGTVRAPELREMDTPAALSFEVVTARFYRLLLSGPSWICDVDLHSGPRLGGWPGKASYTHGDASGTTPALSDELIIDPSKVVDVIDRMSPDGTLRWDAPAGSWTIIRLGHTTTGEENAAHPDAGKGLELDKFRKEALDFHFTHFLDKILSRINPKQNKNFVGITVDSWEAGKQNWTADFPAEFQKRQQYDLTPWMPALTGRIVGSVDETERLLWDVRKTQADLLSENFYGHFASECHRRGLIFNAEPYGDGNFDSLQVNKHLDIPMAEFWTRYIYGSDVYSKQAVSAARIYGKTVVAAEAFTAMPATSKWTDYPYSLKAEGDYFFTLGINRLVFHTFVHQPFFTARPGMTMGPFGTHFDRNNSWAEQAYGWISHLKRSQYLLQQGQAVSDVCYFKGDTPQSGVPDVYTFLPQGYTGDVIGPDALSQKITFEGNTLILPHGMRYRLCIMAPMEAILPSSLKRLKELVAQGMVLLVNSKPIKTYGRTSVDLEVHYMADELYGNLDGKTVTERTFGKGKIIWGKPLLEVLKALGVQPDFTYTSDNQDAAIHFIHKMEGDTEYYYLSNHKRRSENLVCSFRTNDGTAEIWNPETGTRYEAALYETVEERTRLPLTLEPAGAVFVVFKKQASQSGYLSVKKDGKVLISTKPLPEAKLALYPRVVDTFTITAWIKPDTYAHPGRSMLFHAPEGAKVYGPNHAGMALSAGQNGVRVYERSSGKAKVVLEAMQPLEGWTQVAVVYKKGTPYVFINGKLAALGNPSTYTVHPGLSTPAASEQFASYFEGNYAAIQLFEEALSNYALDKLYQKGTPTSPTPTGVHLEKTGQGKLRGLFWQNGRYTFNGKSSSKESTVTSASIRPVQGAWTVRFPKDSGAPAQIELPSLVSLHQHSNFDVRHFSGTATYLKTIQFSKEDLQPDKRIFLDLGSVEVIANLTMNGQKIALLWKDPYRADITDAIRLGANTLEVEVTTLWANRLIGDEHLPVENEYSQDHFILRLPDWYTQNQPKPGERKMFSVWHNLEKTDPLLASGLLGPVRVFSAIHRIID